MVKVCHISSAHVSTDARIFRKECTTLSEAGFDVYLVIEGDSRVENGVHIVGLGKIPKGRLNRMTCFARKAYKTAAKLNCDIYHLHDPELIQYAKKLKKKGKKVIFDSHENTLEQIEEKKWIPSRLRKIVSKLYNKYATGILRKFDCLISVTPHIVNQLKIINPQTYMITNYPQLTPFHHREIESSKVISLCFTGGISPQWSHEQIITLIGDIDNVDYRLCGWGNDVYLNRLKSLPGWEKVKYYGKVPFDTSLKVQNESDVGIALLVPSNNTGGGIGTIGNTKIFEYMMAGLPIICTDFELWQEIVKKYQCGICVPYNDTQKIKKAIEYLYNNPVERQRMGTNGRLAVEKEFNWQSEGEKLIAIYNRIISEIE